MVKISLSDMQNAQIVIAIDDNWKAHILKDRVSGAPSRPLSLEALAGFLAKRMVTGLALAETAKNILKKRRRR